MNNFNRVLLGDVREQLDTLDRHSVHCVVTSPPYWALRDYGVDGQLGLEATPAEYIANQIDVFKRVHRVLRPDGVLWVNLGDTYSEAGKSGGSSGNKNERSNVGRMPRSPRGYGLPSGSQMLIPHRFAIAMQDAGWLLRSTVVWAKKSPMPESVSGWRWMQHEIMFCPRCAATGINRRNKKLRCPSCDWVQAKDEKTEFIDCPGCDKCAANDGLVLSRGKWRCTTGHEYLFQFVKSADYFCDSYAASEPVTGGANSRGRGVNPKCGDGGSLIAGRQNESFSGSVNGLVERRNPRTVWTLSSEPTKLKHFAAYPTAIPRRCVEASTSAAGCCPRCGSQWAPVVETERVPTRPGINSKVTGDRLTDGNRDPQRHIARTVVTGYRPTCDCPTHKAVPSLVLDPYAGSGTTLQVAHQLGRSYLGIELNPDYLPLIEQRINTPLPAAKKSSGQKRRKRHKLQLALFQ